MLEANGKTPFYSQGLNFTCVRCSACCRYESGFVFLSKKDVSMLEAALNMGYKDFTETYCRWIPVENGNERLSLREKSNCDCIFWDEGCLVYQSRPLQCRAFPFWQSVLKSARNWKDMASDCPGMGKGFLHTRSDIEKWLAARQKEPIIERISNFGS